MYDDVLDDPKVQRLPADLFKAWVNLLCLASKNGGILPEIQDVAFALRMGEPEAERHINDLVGRGLIDRADGVVSPHNWNARQFKSDVDPTAADRQRAKRERDKGKPVTDDVTRDMTVTSHPPEQSRADTEQSRADPRAYALELIRDTKVKLNDWEDGFLSTIASLPKDVKLTKTQQEKYDEIVSKLKADGARDIPAFTLDSGHPGFEPWIKALEKQGKPTAFYRKQGKITVPSEYPQEQAA
jgi:hypothetical protein